jgi:hypothetical protein
MTAHADRQSSSDSHGNPICEVHPRLTPAYDVGQAFKALQFSACQASFGQTEARAQINPRFDRLYVTLREAFPKELNDRHREFVTVERECFWNTTNADDRRDEFKEANDRLARDEIRPEEAGREFLTPITRQFEHIRRCIREQFDALGTAAFDFGDNLEQLNCYVKYLEFQRAVEEEEIIQAKRLVDSLAAGPTAASNLSVHCSSVPSLPDDLWNCRFDSGRIGSRGVLVADLQSCWRNLGFSEDGLPIGDLPELPPRVPVRVHLEADANPASSVVAWLDGLISQVNNSINQFDRVFRRMADLDDASQPRVPLPSQFLSYLGLTLDPLRYTVSRDGYEEQKLTKLRYQILLILMTNKDTISSRETLATAWSRADLSSPPINRTMNTEIYRLKKILRCLGITIKNEKRIGWLLQQS